MNRKNLAKTLAVMAAVAILLPLSLFADSRPQYRTNARGDAYDRRTGQIDGVVRDVRDRGRAIVLSTTRGTHTITANGGTRVFYRGRSYRAADLDRGDRVRVTLAGNGRNLRARSIEVLQSASRGYGAVPYGNRDRYGDRDGYRDRDGRDSRNQYATVYGFVSQIDHWNNRFQLRSSEGPAFWVDSRAERDATARRLRIGDRVLVRGVMDRGVFRATDIQLDRSDRR